MYSFSQAIIFNFTISKLKRRNILTTCLIVIIMLMYYTLCHIYQLGENIFGFFTFLLLIPSFIMAAIFAVQNKKFSLRFLLLGFYVQVIYFISDTLARAFSRTFDISLSNTIYWLCIPVFSYVVSFLVRKAIEIIKNLPIKFNKMLWVCILINIFYLIIFCIFFIILNYYEIHHIAIFIGLIFLFLCTSVSSYLMFIFYGKYTKEKYSALLKEEELNNLMEYATIIEDTYINMQSIKHDFNNVLISINSIENSEAKDKFRNIVEESLAAVDFDYMAKLGCIENIAVKSLLSSKIIRFLNHKIVIDLKIVQKINDFYMDDFDIVRVLGILLDNAFEETFNCEQKLLKISIVGNEDGVMIYIENSCREETPAANALIKKGFSTKGKGRGMGLYNLNKIIQEYENCAYRLGNSDSTTFYAKIKIKKI